MTGNVRVAEVSHAVDSCILFNATWIIEVHVLLPLFMVPFSYMHICIVMQVSTNTHLPCMVCIIKSFLCHDIKSYYTCNVISYYGHNNAM